MISGLKTELRFKRDNNVIFQWQSECIHPAKKSAFSISVENQAYWISISLHQVFVRGWIVKT